jgi:hypothetical protein
MAISLGIYPTFSDKPIYFNGNRWYPLGGTPPSAIGRAMGGRARRGRVAGVESKLRGATSPPFPPLEWRIPRMDGLFHGKSHKIDDFGVPPFLHFWDILGMKPPHLTFALHWINLIPSFSGNCELSWLDLLRIFTRKLRLWKKKRIAVPFGSISEAIKLA